MRGVFGILQKGILLHLLNCHAIGGTPFLDAFPTEHGRCSFSHPSWCFRRRQRGELTEAEVNKRREHRSASSSFVEENGTWLEGNWGSKDIKMPSTEHRYLEVLEGGMLVSQTVLDSE